MTDIHTDDITAAICGYWGCDPQDAEVDLYRRQMTDALAAVLPAHDQRLAARARRSALLEVVELLDEERAKWMGGSKQHVALTRLRDRIHKEPVEGQDGARARAGNGDNE